MVTNRKGFIRLNRLHLFWRRRLRQGPRLVVHQKAGGAEAVGRAEAAPDVGAAAGVQADPDGGVNRSTPACPSISFVPIGNNSAPRSKYGAGFGIRRNQIGPFERW